MYQQERLLQLLKQRFVGYIPWLRSITYAEVELRATGHGNSFTLTARWRDGEHSRLFDAAYVLRQGRVSCTRDYARAFAREVLEKRGAS